MNDKKTNQKSVQFEELQVADIIPTDDNPRTIKEKSEAFIELTESIRAQGVIVPVHVRIHPKQKGKFELLAGERRHRASIKASRDLIPAINHGKITDEQAFEITFTENYAREDLTPLEQGKAAVTLLTKYKGDVKAVASKMGKSARWVLQRTAISNNLSEGWQTAVVEHSYLSNVPASHLGLIAGLPTNIQDEILDAAGDWQNEGLPTTSELDKDIAARLRILSKSPWDINDAKLIDKTQACSKCTKRSSHQPGLFDETTDEDVVKKNDRCLDNRCWNRKLEAHIEIRLKELRSKNSNLVCAVMPDERIEHYDRIDLAEKYGNIASQWKASKEGAKDALPALIVSGYNAGELRWIKLTGGSITDIRGRERNVGPDGKSKPKTLKERRDMLNRKRWFQVLRELRGKVENTGVDSIVSEFNRLVVMALAGIVGTWEKKDYLYKDAGDWAKFHKIIKQAEKDPGGASTQVVTRLWEEVRPVLTSRLTYNDAITRTPDFYIEEAKTVAKLLGIDIDALFKAAETDYQEPKSWKSLNADGTQKKAKKTKKKTTKEKKPPKVRTCRKCGCTEEKPCITKEGPCRWALKDLCSACYQPTSKQKKGGKVNAKP